MLPEGELLSLPCLSHCRLTAGPPQPPSATRLSIQSRTQHLDGPERWRDSAVPFLILLHLYRDSETGRSGSLMIGFTNLQLKLTGTFFFFPPLCFVYFGFALFPPSRYSKSPFVYHSLFPPVLRFLVLFLFETFCFLNGCVCFGLDWLPDWVEKQPFEEARRGEPRGV